MPLQVELKQRLRIIVVVSSGINNTSVQFVNVTVPPTSSGQLVFELESYDSSADVALTLTVDLVSGTEEEAAEQIESDFLTQLADYEYNGIPVFSSVTPPSTFRVNRTQHVVTVWSQATFSLKLVSNPTGALIDISSSVPALTTVAQLESLASITGIELTDINDDPYTDEQLTTLIKKFSGILVSYLEHYVVLCTYLNTFIGRDEYFVRTSPRPGYKRDSLVVKLKPRGYVALEQDEVSEESVLPYPYNNFSWVKSTGQLQFLPNSRIIDMRPPWRRDNEVQMTIIAGYKFIPEAVQTAMVQLLEKDQSGELDLKSLAGGSFKVEWDNSKTSPYYDILVPLKRFKG